MIKTIPKSLQWISFCPFKKSAPWIYYKNRAGRIRKNFTGSSAYDIHVRAVVTLKKKICTVYAMHVNNFFPSISLIWITCDCKFTCDAHTSTSTYVTQLDPERARRNNSRRSVDRSVLSKFGHNATLTQRETSTHAKICTYVRETKATWQLAISYTCSLYNDIRLVDLISMVEGGKML